MGFFKDKTMRIAQGGFGAMFCWATSKFLFGVGLGMLLAFYLPDGPWLWIGWALIVLSFLVGLPAAKAAFCKPRQSQQQ